MTKTLLELDVKEIVIQENRAREVDTAWVEALAAIIGVQGMTNPITVREIDGKPVLVSGLHRLAAVRHLGHQAILARMSNATDDDSARLEEVLENLARNELNALDRCHHLYEMKKVYERLHPGIQRGGDRGNQHTGGKVQNLHFGKDGEQLPEFFAFA